MVTYGADDVSLWSQSKNPTIKRNRANPTPNWRKTRITNKKKTPKRKKRKTEARKMYRLTGRCLPKTVEVMTDNFRSSSKNLTQRKTSRDTAAIHWWSVTAVPPSKVPSPQTPPKISTHGPWTWRALAVFSSKPTSTWSSEHIKSPWCVQTDTADQPSIIGLHLPVCLSHYLYNVSIDMGGVFLGGRSCIRGDIATLLYVCFPIPLRSCYILRIRLVGQRLKNPP